MTENYYPRLRYVDAIPIEEKQEVYFYIRDPLEIASSPLVLSPVEFYILTLMDGKHSIPDIRRAFAERFNGLLLPDHHVEKLIDVLESHYYLDSPGFYQRLTEIKREFTESSVRKAWHAGVSYPDDPEVLQQQLDEFYSSPTGAGMPGEHVDGKTIPHSSLNGTWQYPAVMVPHIDLRVGGVAYTHAYRYLLEAGEFDLFIILGVAHFGGQGFYTVTEKDFETPFGVVPTDREFIHRWEQAAGMRLTAEEWIHRSEHSIEFQLLFMQHLIKTPFQIVPVLCGSAEPYLQNPATHLEDVPQVRSLLDGLRTAIREAPKRVALILSVDLAHLGPKFGDSQPITETELKLIEAADHQMFDVLSRWDRPAYTDLVSMDLLPRRVDAVTAVFTLLHIFREGEGKLLRYEQNFQEDTQSVVSYASMALAGNL